MRFVLFFAPLVVLLACGSSDGDADGGSGSGGQVAMGGASMSMGGAAATSGGTTTTSGGMTNSGGATTSGGAATTGGQGSGGQGLVDCDLRKVLCRIVQPTCPEGQVPSVEGSCYGSCVPIESCACSAAAECPFSDRYTCWSRTHCGPYV